MKNKKLMNTKIVLMLIVSAFVLAAVFSGCSSNTGTVQDQDSGSLTVIREEHERDGGESGIEHGSEAIESGGEESGTEYGLNEMYDMVRNGARLILVYDAQSNAFVGTVENTTSSTLPGVRVEVHLSNGIELGPTSPVNLAAGEKVGVMLLAIDQAFSGWSAHPEVGGGETGGEHGSGGSEAGGSDGEHGNGG